MALGLTVVVAALVAGAAFLILRREPGPASIDEAVEDFTAGGTDGAAGDSDGVPRPAEGVYVYAGEGSESLSLLPGDHG